MWLIQHQIWEQEKNRGIIFSRVKTLKAPWHSLEIWLPCICCFMYLSRLFHVFVKVFTSNSHTRNFFSLVNLLEAPWHSLEICLRVFFKDVACICYLYLSELFHTYIFHNRGRLFFSWVNSLEAPWHSLEIRPQKICGLGTPPAYFPRSRLFWTAQKQNATSRPEKASSSLPSTSNIKL